MVQMADRDGDRVCRVVRRRRLLEAEQQLDHLLHLVLVRAAIADDRPLDLRRRVLDHWNAGLHGGEHRHAARMSELQGGSGVDRVEDVLDRDAVRPVLREEPSDADVNGVESLGEAGARRDADSSARDELMPLPVGMHAAEAGALGTGIDPENLHAREASISFSSISKFDQTCCTSSCSSRASISRTIWVASLPSSFT